MILLNVNASERLEMSYKVQFTKQDIVNGESYKKGDVINVSSSIYDALKQNGSIKDFTKAKKGK